ncbi:AAA family ATPase [Paraburkholderia sp. UCT31]|uniref:AAA family ATPase n=1 Tax=Paraburkholderia sp. UCT31 TaxID=2615209 RepID=UPI001655566F|nr:ATP-binding protein [Paraburkholderia sp. UCT31]MBC8742907.1 AAA family ATPase [Paraburkholderia sp. UCT31]
MDPIDGLSRKTVALPHLHVWLARLSREPAFLDRVCADPLMFATFFATSIPHIEWPGDTEMQMREALADDVTPGELMELVEHLRSHFNRAVSGEYAQRFHFAIGAFHRITQKQTEFREHFTATPKAIVALESVLISDSAFKKTPIGSNVNALAEVLQLGPLEKELLLFSIAASLSTDFQLLVQALANNKAVAQAAWPAVFGCSPQELKKTLSDDSALVKSGLVKADWRTAVPLVSSFWRDFLIEDVSTPLFTRLLQPLQKATGAASMSRVPAEDRAILDKVLTAPGFSHPNILIHSDKEVERVNFVADLLAAHGLTGYVLRAKHIPDEDLPAAALLAQRLVAQAFADGQRSVLVVDKAHQVLTRTKVSLMRFFLGPAGDEDDESTSLDQLLLEESPVTTLWLTGALAQMSEENVARFIFHCELHPASRAERQAQVEAYIAGLQLSESLRAELTRLNGLSEQQLKSAVALADSLELQGVEEKEAVVRRAVMRARRALRRDEKEAAVSSVTKYSTKYLNLAGAFGVDKIIESLKKRPNTRLLFYGAPGTGKTQLVDHIGAELGKPILAKHASELLDKYIGETEKHIAQMFSDAEADDSILFLDEADSFLRSRQLAERDHEVSKVNELLQRMMRFNGTFIVATNLMNQVDAAVMRRFPFKLQFLPLSHEQRWEMFLNETGLVPEHLAVERIAELKEALTFIQGLTPGDFATVKNMCILLDQSLAPTEWLEQLSNEVELRKAEANRYSMG